MVSDGQLSVLMSSAEFSSEQEVELQCCGAGPDKLGNVRKRRETHPWRPWELETLLQLSFHLLDVIWEELN